MEPSGGSKAPAGEGLRQATRPVDPLGQTAATDPSTTPALDETARAGSFLPLQPAESPLRPFGPFTRVEPLTEQGAMGFVARGYNAAFDRWELLKFPRPELADDAELVRQFFREGRVLAKLSHPNVVQVFAIYALEGRPCLAMEFLVGKSLQAHVAEAGGKLSVANWHELFLGAARGLAAAHELGLLHRDLKPENLFVVAGRAGAPGGLKLIDFGLATVDRDRRQRHGDDPSLVGGTSAGTPLYMAPELWRGEEASTRSDLYALGLSFFVALTGRLPFPDVETVTEVVQHVCSEQPFPDARELRPELPAPLALALKRTMSKRKEERFATADELVAGLVAAASAARPRQVPGSGPYRGLRPYTAAERDVFFGRDSEIAEALERMRSFPGVVLVGPSGSGKSSLVQAGIEPAIQEGALGQGIAYAAMTLEPGTRPVASLAAALASKLSLSEREIVAFLRKQPASLGEALRAALPAGSGVVVLIDRLEELPMADPGEARDFATAIASLLEMRSAPLRVLAVVRGDRMDALFSLEPLRPLLTRGFYPVRPLAGDGLRRAMVEPALAAGFRLEDPRIVDEVAEDLAKQPGALPLLSFAMSVWWDARDEGTHTLPLAAWRSLGGLAGALTRHADHVVGALGEEERLAAEQILVRLVSAEGTRARVPRASLLDAAAAATQAPRALERLIEAKLVVEAGGDVELAHDALIGQWPRLRALLLSSGEDRAFRERVAAAARQWDVQGRPPGALWSDDQARRLARWFGATNAPLDQVELAFVVAVRRRATRRRAILRAAIASVVLAAISFGLVATANEREMERRLRAATARAEERDQAYRHAESKRLKGVAAANLDRDPTAALRLADASYELEHDSSLDVVAWDARARGIAVPLPAPRASPAKAGPVSVVGVAPKTGTIAAASGGNVVVLSPNSPEHATFTCSDDADVHSLAFSPDGAFLAVGSNSGEVSIARAPAFACESVARCSGPVNRLWAASTGALFADCGANRGPAQVLWMDPRSKATRTVFGGDLGAAAIAADRRAFVLLTRDGRATLVDEGGQTRAGPALSLSGDVTAIDVSPGGDVLVVGESNGDIVTAALDPPGSAAKAMLLAHHHAPIAALSRGPSGAVLAIGADHVAVLATESGGVRSFDVGEPAFAWLGTRNAVALVRRSGAVEVFSLETSDLVADLRSPDHDVVSIAADDAGDWIFAGCGDGTLQAYDLDQAAVALTEGPPHPAPTACALSVDGAAVGCGAAGTAFVRVLQHSSGVPRPLSTLALPGNAVPDHVALGPSGRPLFWLAQGAVAREAERPIPLVTSADVVRTTDERLIVAGQGPDGRPLLDVVPFGLDARPPPAVLASRAVAVAWSETARMLFVAGADRHVRRVSPLSGATLGDVSLETAIAPGDAIASLDSSEDGNEIAVGTRDGLVLVNAPGSHTVQPFASPGAPVGCVRLARSGRALVATAGPRAFVVSLDVGVAFSFWTAPAPIVDCARAADEDRFSFVGADGTAWVKALDLGGVTESYVPPNPASAEAAPTLATWKGLPVGLVH